MTAPTELEFTPEFTALVARARAGDRDALPALRQAFDDTPALWHQAGNLARQAALKLIELAAGGDLVIQEALTRQLDELRSELVETEDGPLQKLLVDRVVLGWQEIHHLDVLLVHLREQFPKNAPIDALERRRNHAQHRYLAAVRTLANVRKLLRRAPSPLVLAGRLAADRAPWTRSDRLTTPQRRPTAWAEAPLSE